jgi:protein TonB
MEDDGALFRSDLGAYGESFGRWLARHRSYPRLAQMRGWQGQVEVRVHVAKKGSVIDVVVTRSSGFEVLDRQALDMVKLADPLPDLPKSLKGQEFTLDIPITFRLEAS